jgi:AraC-type transcriptional regulator N-terminus
MPIDVRRVQVMGGLTGTLHCIYNLGLGVVAQGGKQVLVGGESIDYGPGQSMLATIDLPVVPHVTRASVREPFLGMMLTLDARDILQMASEIDVPQPRRDYGFRSISIEPLDARLLDALVRLVKRRAGSGFPILFRLICFSVEPIIRAVIRGPGPDAEKRRRRRRRGRLRTAKYWVAQGRPTYAGYRRSPLGRFLKTSRSMTMKTHESADSSGPRARHSFSRLGPHSKPVGDGAPRGFFSAERRPTDNC